ncbi:hypothetical protein LCGC14_2494210, partial [marine sediment metagenome]
EVQDGFNLKLQHGNRNDDDFEKY